MDTIGSPMKFTRVAASGALAHRLQRHFPLAVRVTLLINCDFKIANFHWLLAACMHILLVSYFVPSNLFCQYV